MTCRRDNRYVPGMRNFPFVQRFLRGDAATTSTAAPAPTRERERERETLIPFRAQPLLLYPPLIVQNSICPFATLISRSRGQGGLLNRRLKNIGEYSKREGRFYRGGSKNMGCTSVRGENRWIRGEESKKRVFFFLEFLCIDAPLWNVR